MLVPKSFRRPARRRPGLAPRAGIGITCLARVMSIALISRRLGLAFVQWLKRIRRTTAAASTGAGAFGADAYRATRVVCRGCMPRHGHDRAADSRASRMEHGPVDESDDILAALDWHAISCQSESRCDNLATHIVHLHAVHACTHPDVDPHGNRVEILCLGCLCDLEEKVMLAVGGFTRHGAALCATCLAPLRDSNDIIRRVLVL